MFQRVEVAGAGSPRSPAGLTLEAHVGDDFFALLALGHRTLVRPATDARPRALPSPEVFAIARRAGLEEVHGVTRRVRLRSALGGAADSTC